MRTRSLVLVVALSLLAACTSTHKTSPSALLGGVQSTPASAQLLTVMGSDSFVAVRPATPHHQLAVTTSDARTGRVSKIIFPSTWHSLTVQSSAVDAAGHVWLTLTEGPSCTNGTAGCGPKPDSCASEVAMLDRSSGTLHEVFTGSAGEFVNDAQPSPDGTLVAYLDGVCNRSYFNQYLRVRDLKTGRSWTIGAGLPVCHTLGSIAWTADGENLVVRYGRSRVTGTPNPVFGAGTCAAPAPVGLAVVPARQPSGALPGVVAAADRGCEVEATTALNGGYAAIEACRGPGEGSDTFLNGPAQLVRFDKALRVIGRTPIGRCVDGAELRTNSAGNALLGSSYQYCAAGGHDQPRTVTFTYTGTSLKTIVDEANGGSDSVTSISW